MTFPERDERVWNGRIAAEYGCTVTFENERGQSLVRARQGPPIEALRALYDEVTALDPTFRLVSYSTPATIRGDLEGARMDYDGSGGYRRSMPLPEFQAANTAGLTRFVHERLRRGERPATYIARKAQERNA